MQSLTIISYLPLIPLALIFILQIAYFLFKITLKEQIDTIRSTNSSYIILSLGLFMIATGIFYIWVVFFIKKGYTEPFMWISPFIIALTQIGAFINSKILIAKSGIYLSVIPFYISKSKIEAYKIDNNTLILKIKDKDEYIIFFKPKEIEKMENAMSKLLG